MTLRREPSRGASFNESDADLYSIIHWGTALRARGKIVAGALLEQGGAGSGIDGFLILCVGSAAEADEIAASWPVREGVTVNLARVTGIF